jgi:hypothetical protein
VAAKEINPFSIAKTVGKQPIVDFRGNSVPEYDPKETGAIRERAEALPQTGAEIPTQQTPSFVKEEKVEQKESSSVSSAPSSNSAASTATDSESATASGEEKTKQTAKPAEPMLPTLPKSQPTPPRRSDK